MNSPPKESHKLPEPAPPANQSAAVINAPLRIPQPLDLAMYAKDGIPEPVWQVYRYWERGDVVLLSGDGGTKKSMTMIDTAIGLAAGQPVLGGVPVSGPCRVMFIDQDGGRKQLIRRFLAFAKGRGLNLEADHDLRDRLRIYWDQGSGYG
jgi:hypothetical protein